MKNQPILAMLALTSLSMLPQWAHADAIDPKAAQCFKAVEGVLTTNYTPAPRVLNSKMVDDAIYKWDWDAGIREFSKEFTMTVLNARSHQPVIRASCVVNSQGVVISFKELPL